MPAACGRVSARVTGPAPDACACFRWSWPPAACGRSPHELIPPADVSYASRSSTLGGGDASGLVPPVVAVWPREQAPGGGSPRARALGRIAMEALAGGTPRLSPPSGRDAHSLLSGP